MNSEKTYKGGGRGERRRGKAHTPIIISILDVHLLKGASSSPFLNTNGGYVVFVWTRLSESACFVYCPPAASHPLPYYYSSSSSSFSIGADTCVCIIYVLYTYNFFFFTCFFFCNLFSMDLFSSRLSPSSLSSSEKEKL